MTFVDIETGRAAQIGDSLEISVSSPNPLIGVQPLQYTVTDEDVLRSRIELPALVAYEIPSETELLANYPNPFNPETWIPYRLAEDAFVTLTIYDTAGQVVRTLDVGHRIAAVYESRPKAIYWDGKNNLGEGGDKWNLFLHLDGGELFCYAEDGDFEVGCGAGCPAYGVNFLSNPHNNRQYHRSSIRFLSEKPSQHPPNLLLHCLGFTLTLRAQMVDCMDNYLFGFIH